jgi:hypothetical protein
MLNFIRILSRTTLSTTLPLLTMLAMAMLHLLLRVSLWFTFLLGAHKN